MRTEPTPLGTIQSAPPSSRALSQPTLRAPCCSWCCRCCRCVVRWSALVRRRPSRQPSRCARPTRLHRGRVCRCTAWRPSPPLRGCCSPYAAALARRGAVAAAGPSPHRALPSSGSSRCSSRRGRSTGSRLRTRSPRRASAPTAMPSARASQHCVQACCVAVQSPGAARPTPTQGLRLPGRAQHARASDGAVLARHMHGAVCAQEQLLRLRAEPRGARRRRAVLCGSQSCWLGTVSLS